MFSIFITNSSEQFKMLLRLKVSNEMITLTQEYQILVIILKIELISTKVLEQCYRLIEIFFNKTLKMKCKNLGDDHSLTLFILHKVVYLNLMKERTTENIQKLKKTLA